MILSFLWSLQPLQQAANRVYLWRERLAIVVLHLSEYVASHLKSLTLSCGECGLRLAEERANCRDCPFVEQQSVSDCGGLPPERMDVIRSNAGKEHFPRHRLAHRTIRCNRPFIFVVHVCRLLCSRLLISRALCLRDRPVSHSTSCGERGVSVERVVQYRPRHRFVYVTHFVRSSSPYRSSSS